MGYHPRVFERTELPAGPRVISARMPGARSVSIAAYVLAGSRLETDADAGVAHFMEHITFKGTTAYPSTRAISEAIEGVGGSFNAATDRESTVYWVRVPRREAVRAMDVVGELIVRPVLSDHDIDNERTIIIEEIRSYLDDPAEYCQMLFQGAMFGDGPLGREICGDEAGIRALPTATIRDFWRTTYRPANTVIAVAGDLAHDELVELAVGVLRHRQRPDPRVRPGARPCRPARDRRLGKRQTSQAQLSVGVPALHRDHPDAWTLAVLNAVLGDGMSSRLFLSVREARGLAYDVSSGLVDYADAGRARGLGRRGSRPNSGRPSRRSSPSSPGCATSSCPRPSSRRPSAISPAGWSCAWTTPATSRPGSVARRPSTIASWTSTRRWPP